VLLSTPSLAKVKSAAGVDLATIIQELTDQMHVAAGELQFELAARLRDEVSDLKRELRGMQEAGQA
jgi:excinuclease ABC subunit B